MESIINPPKNPPKEKATKIIHFVPKHSEKDQTSLDFKDHSNELRHNTKEKFQQNVSKIALEGFDHDLFNNLTSLSGRIQLYNRNHPESSERNSRKESRLDVKSKNLFNEYDDSDIAYGLFHALKEAIESNRDGYNSNISDKDFAQLAMEASNRVGESIISTSATEVPFYDGLKTSIKFIKYYIEKNREKIVNSYRLNELREKNRNDSMSEKDLFELDKLLGNQKNIEGTILVLKGYESLFNPSKEREQIDFNSEIVSQLLPSDNPKVKYLFNGTELNNTQRSDESFLIDQGLIVTIFNAIKNGDKAASDYSDEGSKLSIDTQKEDNGTTKITISNTPAIEEGKANVISKNDLPADIASVIEDNGQWLFSSEIELNLDKVSTTDPISARIGKDHRGLLLIASNLQILNELDSNHRYSASITTDKETNDTSLTIYIKNISSDAV